MISRSERSFLQPTLSLYLGGTGVRIGEDLLSILEELPPAERSAFEPFFIDAQEPAISDPARSFHCCYRDLGVFSEPIYRDFEQQRFPENLGVSPVYSSCEGCGVTRIFGAASLVACRDGFSRLIEDAAGRLKRGRRTSTQPLQVFLTASACGGTGAGMILDAAALTRHLFRRRLGESPRIFLFLIGPRVFFEDPAITLKEEQRNRMAAASYALLKELHHFAQGNPFRSAYRLRDEVVEISNAADDDRLFDWVYFLDGSPQGAPARSLEEVAWTVAETQVHLATTEVGRKVAESLPNQREERVREFGLHFVHPDNKELLSVGERERLARSSRRTFLASFSLCNLRFPAAEIRRWFQWRWTAEALDKVLEREDAGTDTNEAQVVAFDRVLGYDAGRIDEVGLLADLGLTEERLLRRVERPDDTTASPLPAPFNARVTTDRLISEAEGFLGAAEALLNEIQGGASPRGAGAEVAGALAARVSAVTAAWSADWGSGLEDRGWIAERLWPLAWDPAAGRGLRWLDAFVVHAAELLTAMARDHGRHRPDLVPLKEQLTLARERLAGLRRSRDGEGRSLQVRARRLVASLRQRRLPGSGETSPYGVATVRKAGNLIRLLNTLRRDLLAERYRALAAAVAPQVWKQAGRALRSWRDRALVPTLTAAENAARAAADHRDEARRALARHQGTNGRGRWSAPTTLQLADDGLLHSLEQRLADRVRVEDLVLAPLHETGIAHERLRLTVDSLREQDGEAIAGAVLGRIAVETRQVLSIVDGGWRLEEVRSQLETYGARALDRGTEPLLSFSQEALGVPTQSYLLAPEGLQLPTPFGRRAGHALRLAGQDPLQLGVVSFAYGIPPNALTGMREMFAQYRLHLGDQHRNRANDRYPLHVFRGAAEEFDEPYSPLTIGHNEVFLDDLLEAARILQLGDGRLQLDVREFEGTREALEHNWNRTIELIEAVCRRLDRSPARAADLFAGARFAELQRLYNARKCGGPRPGAGSPRPPDGDARGPAGDAGGDAAPTGDRPAGTPGPGATAAQAGDER